MKNNWRSNNEGIWIVRKAKEWFYYFRSMSFVKHIFVFYLFITILGSLVLYMHGSQTGHLAWAEKGLIQPTSPEAAHWHDNFKDGYLAYIDALFIAASAFSDTGLSPYSTGIVFNEFGQAIIAILIFIGGIGWFALKVYIFNIIFDRPIALRTRESLAAERGSVKIGITKDLIRVAVTTLLVLTAIFSVVLSIYFYYSDVPDVIKDHPTVGKGLKMSSYLYENPHHNPLVALRFGIFHTISALNNAGFDIMGNYSLTPYYYNYGIQIIFIVLFVIGGMGYPVIYDVYRFFQTKFHGEKFKFSLFTKLSVSAYFAIAAIGVSTTFIIESTAKDSFWIGSAEKYGSRGDKTMAIFFNTMSTRNAGFSTISMHDLSRATLIQYTALMFIGSAPSSTAGGIRTTTMALVVLGVWARFRGRKSVYVFKRKINQDTVNRAYVVFSISMILVVIGSLIAVSSFDTAGGNIKTLHGVLAQSSGDSINKVAVNDTYDFTEVLFEVASAFGTTGLSAGITSSLSVATKITLALLMFIGQLGVTSSILIWGKRTSKSKHYSRVESDITIG